MKKVLFVWLLSAVFFGWDLSAQAAPPPPKTITYQGYLKDASGVPANGSVAMIIRLYDAATNGTTLWEEKRTVPVTNGLYSINLGEVTPFNLPFDQQYWLGIFVGGGPELLPRQQLSHTPYAFRSTVADTIPDKSVTAAKLGQTCADGEGEPEGTLLDGEPEGTLLDVLLIAR